MKALANLKVLALTRVLIFVENGADVIKVEPPAGDDYRHIGPFASGQMLHAFALTEPDAGSDPASMTTLATRQGDSYRIKGTKHFISNAGAADLIVIYAKTDPALGGKGVSAFAVERQGGGITTGKAERRPRL